MTMINLIKNLPKVELHIHIEGSLEPEMMFQLAKRNQIQLPYRSIADAKAAYNFHNLQSFLDLFYLGSEVLQTEEDFYDLTWEYLKKIASQNVRHTEIFFDPQSHLQRGISFNTVINGIHEALAQGEKQLNISSYLIMCFLRHLSAQSAIETLEKSLPFQDKIVAVGLDSSEIGNPPSKFIEVFKQAKKYGFKTVAHAGEEGDSSYIWEAITLLNVDRIDHGVKCSEDPLLLEYLAQHQIPLTVCPLSNVKLKVFPSLKEHNLKQLLDRGLCVTINSDDPAYFGGYILENYLATQASLNLTLTDFKQLIINAINGSFLPRVRQEILLSELISSLDVVTNY